LTDLWSLVGRWSKGETERIYIEMTSGHGYPLLAGVVLGFEGSRLERLEMAETKEG
jgi:hypothetical protein